MVLQHISPVFFLLLLGYLLKRYEITNATFLATTDRLIYFIFFPLLLFWKIGGADPRFTTASVRFYLAAGCTVALIYLLSLAIIRLGRLKDYQAGTFSQSCYRFNTYVGMAIVSSFLGESGAAQFGVLIGLLIPMINILAVSTLIWFSGTPSDGSQRRTMLVASLVSNPLILGCAAGLLYTNIFKGFPPFIDNILQLSASVTLPLALLSIGGSLTLKTLKTYLGAATTAAGIKLVALPLLGWAMLRLWSVEGLFFQVGLIFFALPASTAIYVLSSQLNSDTELASATIALSTLLSAVSLSMVLGLLHE